MQPTGKLSDNGVNVTPVVWSGMLIYHVPGDHIQSTFSKRESSLSNEMRRLTRLNSIGTPGKLVASPVTFPLFTPAVP